MWPPRAPTAAPATAVPISAGGKISPTRAPIPAPPQAPLRVPVSSLLTCTLPLSSLVMTAASNPPITLSKVSSLMTA